MKIIFVLNLRSPRRVFTNIINETIIKAKLKKYINGAQCKTAVATAANILFYNDSVYAQGGDVSNNALMAKMYDIIPPSILLAGEIYKHRDMVLVYILTIVELLKNRGHYE